MFKVSLANKRDKQTRKIHGKRRKIAVVNSLCIQTITLYSDIFVHVKIGMLHHAVCILY